MLLDLNADISVCPMLIFSLFYLFRSSSAANAALNYINYPTRVIFRSCKLVPTIIIAMMMHRKRFQVYELLLGVAMSLGMVMFALADYQVSAVSSVYGIFLVSFSVIADSVLPNYQVEVQYIFAPIFFIYRP